MTAAPTEAASRDPEGSSRPERPDAFISYSRKDQDFVRRLVEALEASGKDVWVDWDDIRKTADWRATIAAGVEAARTVLAVLSPDFAASEICREEIDHAVRQNKRLIPILRRELEASELPDELKAPNWIFCRDGDDFEQSLEEVVEAIETDLEWLDAHARLLVRATEWDREGRNASFLLRGRDLQAAESWLGQQGSHRESATPLQGEYIVASRRATQRRQGITLGAVLVALAATALLAALAWLQRNEAVRNEQTARSRELAAAATAELDTDPELSVVLAREAVGRKPTVEAEQVLRRALASARVLATTATHGGWVVNAGFSPDGRRFVTSSRDGTARVFDAANGRQLAVLRHGKSVSWAEFSPDGERVATSSADGTARVWTADGRELVVLRGHRGRVSQARFSENGERVLTCGLDGTPRIWDARTGSIDVALTGHTAWTSRCLFVPGGALVATAADDGTARLWDARTGEQRNVLDAAEESVLILAVSPDGRYLATGATTDGTVRVWETASGDLHRDLVGHLGVITSLAFSPDGRELASGGQDAVAHIWDVETGTLRRTLRGQADAIPAVTYSPDGSLLATTAGNGSVRVWDVNGAELLDLRGHGGWVGTASFDPAGERLLTGAADRTARVWDVQPAPTSFALGKPELITQARISPDGSRVATVGFRSALWSTANGRNLGDLVPGGGRGRVQRRREPSRRRQLARPGGGLRRPERSLARESAGQPSARRDRRAVQP